MFQSDKLVVQLYTLSLYQLESLSRQLESPLNTFTRPRNQFRTTWNLRFWTIPCSFYNDPVSPHGCEVAPRADRIWSHGSSYFCTIPCKCTGSCLFQVFGLVFLDEFPFCLLPSRANARDHILCFSGRFPVLIHLSFKLQLVPMHGFYCPFRHFAHMICSSFLMF